MPGEDMMEIAGRVVETAIRKGAAEAAVGAYRSRQVEVQWRDGRVEKITEATTRGLGLEIYVANRYSAVSTSDLRPEALDKFIGDAIALARTLAPDPFRALPDPKLYAGQSEVELQVEDPGQPAVTPAARLDRARALEAAARPAGTKAPILSVTTGVGDNLTEIWRIHSNGFDGRRRETMFWSSAEVSVQDPDGRKPEETDEAVTRLLADLPDAASVGQRACARAQGRVGARKGGSAVMSVAVDARVAGRFVSYLLQPMSAAALQQKRSCFDGKIGAVVGSAQLDVSDDPLVVKGLGSRRFDGEGLAARRLPLFTAGTLTSIYVDNYYGKKLGMPPTTGSRSNLSWKLGEKSQPELLAQMHDGILVTGFLGGNSNPTTGDFSLGVLGFYVRGGAIAEPFAEMNMSGNHLETWKHLTALGNDPYPYSSSRTPTMLLESMQIAGT